MFIVQAHSFSQQARLAVTLAWVAGYTNIITILACGHVTSHVSGTTSDLGRFLSEGRWTPASFLLYLLVMFALGALASGLMTELGRRRAWESLYVLPMAVEAVLLAALAVGLEFGVASLGGGTGAGSPASEAAFFEAQVQAQVTRDAFGGNSPLSTGWLLTLTGIASAAMGLQNATITRISSGVVRTTHVTGVLTDLGLEFALFLFMLRDRARQATSLSAAPASMIRGAQSHITSKRLALLASIMGSFALGAGLSTLAYELWPRWAMFPPVVFLLWLVYQDLVRPIAEIEPSSLVDENLGLDERLGVFHLVAATVDDQKAQRTRRFWRRRVKKPRTHRMPNLTAWVDRLPVRTRVVILDLSDVTQIEHNSVLEIRAVLGAMRRQRRHLVLAGISPQQYEQLRAVATGDLLSPLNACADLELAVARGLNLLEELDAEATDWDRG